LFEVTVDKGHIASTSPGMDHVMHKLLSIQSPVYVKLHTGTVPPSTPGSGTAATISNSPDNRLTTGTDGGLFVPEITIDPLAYYILARN
jgi:hypothetical protein